ncbi:hypothetical protein VNO77_23721 [Canavalia gladiata]|uniref:Uncharacterized protein n=1 Tax=Canavalia gladiata TaxID=3824 RepID=A0AAN9L5R2_CANGL
MADSLMQLLRLLDENPVEGAQAQAQPRRHRNTRGGALRHNAPSNSHNSPPQSFNNSSTQNMKGLINNAGYVQGNGNGSIIFGGFDSSTRTFN